ncbi:hypothetical protein NDU88_006820 [Pleurodeles waltl]|uniref:Uncharacterized protein n=1 Tax=Pleurodeles waltl TaxID=8319 RepID=A0AAV7QJV7_PLEWA|nr:hypothetical protein NDU88_006820 [Pleurodeles waltl]
MEQDFRYNGLGCDKNQETTNKSPRGTTKEETTDKSPRARWGETSPEKRSGSGVTHLKDHQSRVQRKEAEEKSKDGKQTKGKPTRDGKSRRS